MASDDAVIRANGLSRDVLVIGAGPAGSATAAGLAARGWDTLLVERDRLPRHKVCGEFLSPEAQRTLEALGLRRAVRALGPASMTDARLVTAGGRGVTLPLPGTAWGVSRHALDAALAAGAASAGATVRTGCTVTSVARDERGREADPADEDGCHGVAYTVRLRGPEAARRTVRARLVVAAGGRHTRSGLPPRPRDGARTDDRAHDIGVKLHLTGLVRRPEVELYLFPGGYVGLAPVEGGRTNVCLLVTGAAFRDAGRTVDGVLSAIRSSNPAFRERMAGARRVADTVVTVAPVDTRRPGRAWDDMACVGDAAGMIPPLCGDGMAMALRGAELLVPLADAHLRGALDADRYRAAYERAWRQAFLRPLRVGQALERLLGRAAVAELLVAAAGAWPWLGRRLVGATRAG